MVRVTYTGLSHVRKISAADFKSVGIEDAEAINLEQGQSVEVSQAVADFLEKNEPRNDWKVEESAPASASASGDTGKAKK